MFEFIIVIFIILLFIFPIPLMVLLVGAGIAYLIYRKYLLVKGQPKAGKKIILLSSLTQAANLVASLVVSLLLALFVHILIFNFIYLFAFNLILCFLISWRWFDFTHLIYRHFIVKFMGSSRGTEILADPSTFVGCLGLRKSTGIGPGMVPFFMDAGYLRIQEDRVFFDGVFLKQPFDPEAISCVEKSSSDKIKITLQIPAPPLFPDAFLIVLKDQFYPFKSRKTRDEILRRLQSMAASAPAPAN